MSKTVQNALLALLGAAAVASSAFAIWSVNRPPATVPLPADPAQTSEVLETGDTGDGDAGDDADGTGTGTGTQGGVADPAEATTAMADPGATTGPLAGDTEDDSATDGQDDDGDAGSAGTGPLAAWQEAISGEDSALLVLGDGYSNLPSQWLQLWATQLGADRPVQIHHWGEAADVSFNDPIELAAGEGPALTVWSASRAGATIGSAGERLEQFTSEAGGTDAILISMGRSSADEDVEAALEDLVGQIDEDLPVLVTVGPRDLYGDGVADAIVGWAQGHEERVGLVDLRDLSGASAQAWAAAFGEAVAD